MPAAVLRMPELSEASLRPIVSRAALALQPVLLLALLLPSLLALPVDAGWRTVPAAPVWYTVQPGPPPGAADAGPPPALDPVGLAVLPVQPGGRYRVTLSYRLETAARSQAAGAGTGGSGPSTPPRLALRMLGPDGLWPEFAGAAPAAPGPHTPDPADPACLQWTAEVTVRPEMPDVLLLMEPARPLCRLVLQEHAPTLWLRAWQQTSRTLTPAALVVEALALATLATLFRRALAAAAGRLARELAALLQAAVAQVRDVAALLLVVLAVTLGADWKWGLHAQFAALWLGAVLLRRMNGRDSILAALLTLLTCPILLIARQERWAETMGDLTYILLVIGVVQQAVELLRERGAPGDTAQAGEMAAPAEETPAGLSGAESMLASESTRGAPPEETPAALPDGAVPAGAGASTPQRPRQAGERAGTPGTPAS